jgi:PAS domain S-box-containing protein
VLESITDGFFALHEDWTFIYVNNAFERLLGRERAGLIGNNIWREFPEMRHMKFYAEYCKAMKEKVTVHFDEYFYPREMYVSVSAYPQENGITVYFQDITHRKEYDFKILRQNQIFREIAYIQSHEIRNHVAAIMGLIGLFDKQSLNAENQVLLQFLEKASNNLDNEIQKIVEKTYSINKETDKE